MDSFAWLKKLVLEFKERGKKVRISGKLNFSYKWTSQETALDH